MVLFIKRIYDHPLPSDGKRVLVDRLWPRGMSRNRAQIDLWLKDIAPSNALRKWFNHELEKWEEFKKRYYLELSSKQEMIEELDQMANDDNVTLVFSARNEDFNNAVVIRDYISHIHYSQNSNATRPD